MCTNYLLAMRDREELIRNLGAIGFSDFLNPEGLFKDGVFDMWPAYNGPILHLDDGKRVLASYKWCLLTPWMDDPKDRTLYNARGDTVHEKRSFAKPFKTRRCLIPAGGYYEKKPKQERLLFELPEHELFCFAGVWDEWKREVSVRSYAMITTIPNATVEPHHDRMPVILQERDYDRWLDPKSTLEELQDLMVPFDGKMTVKESPRPIVEKAAKEEKPKKEPRAKKEKSVKETKTEPTSKSLFD